MGSATSAPLLFCLLPSHTLGLRLYSVLSLAWNQSVGGKRQRGGGALAAEMHLFTLSTVSETRPVSFLGRSFCMDPHQQSKAQSCFLLQLLSDPVQLLASYYETNVYLFIYWGWRWCWHMGHRMCVVRGQPAGVSPFLPPCEFPGLNQLSHLTSSQVYSCNQMYLYFSFI